MEVLDFSQDVTAENPDLFLARVKIGLETDRYIVKTADKISEVRKALELRHETFFVRDLGKSLPGGLDVDSYDADSDHLLVIERESGSVIGNYRIRSSAFHDRFYCESEFVLRDFWDGGSHQKIEIGRACVHPDFRRGGVIQLLWRGIVEYLQAVEARYLFGCSSVSTRVPGQIEAVWDYITRNNLFSREFGADPRTPYVFKPVVAKDFAMPSLLGAYIKAGAKVLGNPAYDAELECADFLTILDVRELSRTRARRYFLSQ